MAIPESRRKPRRTQAWSPPMMLRQADQDEAGHAGVDIDEPESFVLRILACRVHALGDVVPPRLDLMLGVAGFLQPFTVCGHRANQGTFKLDERPPDPDRVGFRDEEVGDVAGAEARLWPKPPAMPAGQDTGEQMRMILQVELDRFLVPGRLDHAAELVNVVREDQPFGHARPRRSWLTLTLFSASDRRITSA